MSGKFKEILLELNKTSNKDNLHGRRRLAKSGGCYSKTEASSAALRQTCTGTWTTWVFGQTTQTEKPKKKQQKKKQQGNPTDGGKREQEATGRRPPLPSHRHGNTKRLREWQAVASCGKDNVGNGTRTGNAEQGARRRRLKLPSQREEK